MWKLEFVFRALNHYYFMIHTFSFVIQQSLFDLQPCWILMNWKFRGGLDNVAEKSRAVELNMILNEGFICVNPLFQEFICINPSFGCNHSISLFCLFRQSMNCPQCIYSCIWRYLRLVAIILFHSTAYSDQVWTAHCPQCIYSCIWWYARFLPLLKFFIVNNQNLPYYFWAIRWVSLSILDAFLSHYLF